MRNRSVRQDLVLDLVTVVALLLMLAPIIWVFLGSIKPEPEIYHHAIQVHGLKPAETRYIDDLPANIETGRHLGFRTWQYDLNDHPAFERWLAAELLLS